MTDRDRKSFLTYWKKVPTIWRSTLVAFVAGRLFFSAWSLIISLVFPVAVYNTTLFGSPAVFAFDMRSQKGYVYSRQVNGTSLLFRYLSPGKLVDTATHSTWRLEDGSAIVGEYKGTLLQKASSTADEIFPYHHARVSSLKYLASWQRYDTNWYLTIAENGYHADDGTMAFFPFYPFLIRMLGSLLGDDLLAALLISNLALLGGMYFLGKLTERYFGLAAAQRVLVYLIIFPTSFFFFAAYTEALFLLFATAAFSLAYRHRWGWTGILAALATLTRAQGVLLCIPLALIWYKEGWQKQRSLRQFIPLLLVPLVFVSFQIYTGGRSAANLAEYWNARTALPWENVWLVIQSFLNGKGSVIAGFNISCAIIFFLICILVWKDLPLEYLLYSVLVLLLPLFRINAGEPMVSYARYALAAFPVFMELGKRGTHPWIHRLILYAGFPFLLYFFTEFLLWGWAG